MEETAITIVPRDDETPNALLSTATMQADALAGLIRSKGLAIKISGREYVKVEGWVPLARMNGVIPREVSVEERDDGRYIATVALVRISDGVELTRASGECGDPDERTWASRPRYARRSMAITRATGKACRLAYSWVMSLAGYEPTPAEEMEPVFEREDPRPRTVEARPMPAQPAAKQTPTEWAGYLSKIDPPKKAANGASHWAFYTADGRKFTTFSDTVADLVSGYIKEKAFVIVEYEATKYGDKALGVSLQKIFEEEGQ